MAGYTSRRRTRIEAQMLRHSEYSSPNQNKQIIASTGRKGAFRNYAVIDWEFEHQADSTVACLGDLFSCAQLSLVSCEVATPHDWIARRGSRSGVEKSPQLDHCQNLHIKGLHPDNIIFGPSMRPAYIFSLLSSPHAHPSSLT